MAKRVARKSSRRPRTDHMFSYASRPSRSYYRNENLHEDFQTLVNSEEGLECHKFLKAAAALEGVPMLRLHKLSAATKRKLKTVIGDNKELKVGECRRLMKDMTQILLND